MSKQLDLALGPIRDLYASTDDGKSNTMELFDALVTFSPEHARAGSHFLEIEKRVHNHIYRVTMKPAALKKNGKLINVLPARRENLVEKALRKLAVDTPDALKVNVTEQGRHELWVNFTMHQLRSLLRETGHEYKVAELTDALTVLAECKMDITGETEDEIGGVKGSGILSEIVWRRKKVGDEEGRAYRVAVKLHPLVTRSILERTTRCIDYAKFMKPKNELFRFIYGRMSHNYVQADQADIMYAQMGEQKRGYHLLLSTIIRETAMSFSDLRLAARAVRTALAVAKEYGVTRNRDWTGNPFPGYIEEIQYAPITGKGRPKIADILFRIFPSEAIIEDIIKANSTKKMLSRRLPSPQD